MAEDIEYDLAHYDGGLPFQSEPCAKGTLKLTSHGGWELRFKGTRKRVDGDIADYRFEADDLETGGCEVTMREKTKQLVAAVFDLTNVSADAFLGELALREEETAAIRRQRRVRAATRSRQPIDKSPSRTRPPRTVGDVLAETQLSTAAALLGFLLVGAGSVGPWVETLLGSLGGLEGDGRITIVAAATGLLALVVGHGRRARQIVAALAAVVALVTAGYDFTRIRDAVAGATLFGHRVADVGWGPLAVLAGAVIALVALVVEARQAQPVRQQRSS